MKNQLDTYFIKYLNNDLSDKELTALKASDKFEEYEQLMASFKQDMRYSFNKDEAYNTLLERRKTIKKTTKTIRFLAWKKIASIAAAVVIGFSLTYMMLNHNNSNTLTSYVTAKGDSDTFLLPDDSKVFLNVDSKISYETTNWENNRQLSLNGEAYFEVEKGQKFTVKTPIGNVSVLGTKFNVMHRNNDFEVHCFEGSVSVAYNNKNYILKANDRFTNTSNGILTNQTLNQPNWRSQKSVFNNVPLQKVLDDITRHYNIKFNTTQIKAIEDYHFTGSYNHYNPVNDVVSIICQSFDLRLVATKDNIYYLSADY